MTAEYLKVQRMIHHTVRLTVSALPNQSIHKFTDHRATSMRQLISDYRVVWR